MDELNANILVAIILALIAAIPGVLAFIRGYRQDRQQKMVTESTTEKLGAEVTESLIKATKVLLDPLNSRLAVLECKNADLNRQIAEIKRDSAIEIDMLSGKVTRLEEINVILCNGIRVLIGQIRSLGARPLFEIEPELCDDTLDENLYRRS